MPHAIWTGSIAFGLVNIPVKLYPAIEHQAISFRMLHKECFNPIKLKRYCPACKKELELKDIVKGLKYKEKEYYVLTQEEIASLKMEKTPTINIAEFVDKRELRPILVQNSYFVVPAQKKEKAFFLFKEALKETDRIAIGRFVLREKEYTVAIEDFETGLLLTVLNYAYEIRDIKELEELAEKVRLEAKEKALAIELVEKLSEAQGKLDIAKYKDSFREKLEKLLAKKARGEKIKIPAVKRVPKEKTLMEALKASLKEKKK